MPSEASTFRGDQSMEELRRELAEAREQQAATAAILAAIPNSPIDPYRVFAEIAASAARLCEAYDAVIFQVDGAVLRLVAHEGPVSLGPVGQFTVPLVRGSLTGRVTLERRTIQLADHQAEEVEYPAPGRTHIYTDRPPAGALDVADQRVVKDRHGSVNVLRDWISSLQTLVV